jgi:hypothetical protein
MQNFKAHRPASERPAWATAKLGSEVDDWRSQQLHEMRMKAAQMSIPATLAGEHDNARTATGHKYDKPANRSSGESLPVRLRRPVSQSVSPESQTLPSIEALSLLPTAPHSFSPEPHSFSNVMDDSAASARFVPPRVPNPGIYDTMHLYNPSNVRPYIHFLKSLEPSAGTLSAEDMKYTRLQPQPNHQEMNAWLLLLIPANERRVLLNTFQIPPADDCNAIARCIRYANSHAQKKLSWCLHPVHVALIAERTNEYGIAIVAPKEEKDEGVGGFDEGLFERWLVEYNSTH